MSLIQNSIMKTFCHHYFLPSQRSLGWTVFLLFYLHSSVIASETNIKKSTNINHFLTLEIEGISLKTPLETVPSILEKHGYEQTGSMTFIKQNQHPGQRKSNYRIEVEGADKIHRITYFRGKSGGRIKSPPKQEEPILPNEIEMAKELHDLVCSGITTEEQEKRSCLPITASNISFGDGGLLEIGSRIGVKLDASAATTTIEIKSAQFSRGDN